MERKRKYFGTIYLKKVWVGKKSVNLRIEPIEARKLSNLILESAKTEKDFDLNTFWTKRRKLDNRVSMTITQGLKDDKINDLTQNEKIKK